MSTKSEYLILMFVFFCFNRLVAKPDFFLINTRDNNKMIHHKSISEGSHDDMETTLNGHTKDTEETETDHKDFKDFDEEKITNKIVDSLKDYFGGKANNEDESEPANAAEAETAIDLGGQDVSGWEGGCGKADTNKNEISGGKNAKPHSYPWIVRLDRGCALGLCAGSLITKRIVVTADHCTRNPYHEEKPCDHSDGKRLAVLGLANYDAVVFNDAYKIPVIDVRSPPGASNWPYHACGNHGEKNCHESHDYALLILKEDVKFSATVRPICLPLQGANYIGKMATAAGWGRFATSNISSAQSVELKEVDLMVETVQNLTPRRPAMFTTKLERNEKGIYKDPCSGDSGGPLMYKDPKTGRYVLIGTVQGGGYSCKTDKIQNKEYGQIWNNVSYWADWTKQNLKV